MSLKSKKSELEPKQGLGARDKSSVTAENISGEQSPDEIMEIEKRATLSKELQRSLGEIVSLLLRRPELQNMTLADVRSYVIPAILSDQYMIAESQSESTGMISPAAAILWASVSEEVDRRLSQDPDQPLRLAPEEWKSGDNHWLILATGNKRLIDKLLQQLKKLVLQDRPLKTRIARKDAETLANEMGPQGAE